MREHEVMGSGADGRDGDLEPGWPPGTRELPAAGTMRRIAHHFAGRGLASMRWDRRGFGASDGRAEEADYDSDLEDAIACLGWLQSPTGGRRGQDRRPRAQRRRTDRLSGLP